MKWLSRAGYLLVGLLIIIQFVPYGRDHENPPVVAEPTWDSSTTRELARRACFDCHSNETLWPWYANVAPLSWFIQTEVDEGRAELNFSKWNTPQEGNESAETVRERSMPPWLYQVTRSRLSEDELQTLTAGLAATLGDERRGEGAGEDDDD
jgi:mono/diheme cytochrome c family protein